MSEVTGIGIALPLAFGAGWLLLRALRLDAALAPADRVWIAGALGIAAIAYELLVFALLDLPLHRAWLLAPWLVPLGVALGRRRQASPSQIPDAPPLRERWLAFAFVAAAGFASALMLSESFSAPFLSGDAIDYWTPKAKIFWEHRDAPHAAFQELDRFRYPSQPLLFPLSETWLFLWVGGPDVYALKILFPLYALLLIASIWRLTTRLAGAEAGLLAGTFAALTPILIDAGSTGYADAMLSLFFWASCAFLFLWHKERNAAYLLLAGCFAGLATCVKSEGRLLALLVLALTPLVTPGSLLRARVPATAALAALVAAVAAPWWLAQRHFGYVMPFELPAVETWGSLWVERGPRALTLFGIELFGRTGIRTSWSLAWYVLLAGVTLRHATLLRGWLRYPLLLLVVWAGAVVSLVVMMETHVDWIASGIYGRLMLHCYPLALLVTSALAAEWMEREVHATRQ